MQFKTINIIIFAFILSGMLFGQDRKQAAVEQFVAQSGLEQASIGFCVKDMSGETIAEYNMDKSYTPASILKIVTTAAALEILSPGYRYETFLAKGKNNTLIISGTGDPTLGTEHLGNNRTLFIEEWSGQISRTFDKSSKLNLLIRDDFFGYQGISRKWIYEDIGNYYASGAYGISVFDNTYKLTFNTTDKSKGAQMTKADPQVGLKFTNTLSLNTTGKDNGYIMGAPFSRERFIIGDIPANRTAFTIKGSIPDPGLFLGETIAKSLEKSGFDVNSIKTAYNTYHEEMHTESRTDYAGTVFYTHQSPVLSSIIRNINEKSNNHYAEHLIRTLGRKRDADIYSSALDEGIEAVKVFWANKGLNTDALFMYDGSGLSPSNAISASLMCDILVYMQGKSKNSKSFLSSLPKAGEEGTVRNFLKGTSLAGKVWVKSGSISGVQCYTGYYIEEGREYAFTIMVNNYNSTRSQLIGAIEKLLAEVFSSRK